MTNTFTDAVSFVFARRAGADSINPGLAIRTNHTVPIHQVSIYAETVGTASCEGDSESRLAHASSSLENLASLAGDTSLVSIEDSARRTSRTLAVLKDKTIQTFAP